MTSECRKSRKGEKQKVLRPDRSGFSNVYQTAGEALEAREAKGILAPKSSLHPTS